MIVPYFIVAFTPKDGCPLKLIGTRYRAQERLASSIHPQGWVPIETRGGVVCCGRISFCSIHP